MVVFLIETCTIEDVLYYDLASSDRTSEYSVVAFEGTAPTISYSDNGYYILNPMNNKTGGVTIPYTPTKLEVTFKMNNTSAKGGIGLTVGNGNGICIFPSPTEKPYCYMDGHWQGSSSPNTPNIWNSQIILTTHWYSMTIEKDGTTLNIICTDLETGATYTGSTTVISSFDNGELCLFCSGSSQTYFKEIKVL